MKKKTNPIKLAIIPLVFSSVFLLFGTYAWFTYFSDIDSSLTGHVIGWNIDFDGVTDIEDEYEINITEVYPGMPDFESILKITNSGEAYASITYALESIRVFDETYTVGDVVDGATLTSDSLIEFIDNKYPFKFTYGIDQVVIGPEETGNFKLTLVWPFETYVELTSDVFNNRVEYYTYGDDGYELADVNVENFNSLKNSLYVLNDAEDTYWGMKANEFKKQSDETMIEMKLMIHATQYLEDE